MVSQIANLLAFKRKFKSVTIVWVRVREQKEWGARYRSHSHSFVDPSGLEPELFWTKIRRVANYTMGQSLPHKVLQN